VSRPGLWLLTAVGLLLAVPLQVNVLPGLLSGPWAPHLGVLVVFLAGLVYGEGPGVMLGLVMGLLYDRFTVGEMGLHLLLLPAVGVGTAAVRRLVPEMGLGGHLVLLAVVVAAAEVLSAVLFHLAGSLRLDFALVFHQFLPAVLANVAWGGLVLLAIEGRHRRAGSP
jgi:rod shape-determining protein MreD